MFISLMHFHSNSEFPFSTHFVIDVFHRNIYHACSMNPEHVRREVFILKTDFNYRLKTVYYEAIISVYYGTVIPVIFCKVSIS